MNETWNLKEMKKLIPLALPVLVVNLSIVGMGAVDAIVAGRAGVTDMAAVALGSSVYLPVALFACGVLMIIGPVIANMRGKSHESRVGYMTNHGLVAGVHAQSGFHAGHLCAEKCVRLDFR